MSYVAEFIVSTDGLPFAETLAANPEARIELERIVPTDQSALPFFWVWGSDPERFVESAEAEPEISNTRLLDTVQDGALFRAEWSPDATIVGGLRELDATILESEGTAEQWRFELRSEERRSFTELQELFRAEGVSLSLNRLYDLEELVEGERRRLTAEQRETLVRAYREGYYDDPRAITQAELGEVFDVSHRAISDRLRRGTRNLIAESLVPDHGG